MSAPHTILQTLGYFKDRRLLSIFCFGIASGYPWVMIGSAMSGWLTDASLSRSSIGLFGLIFVAYSINFLWSPLVDRLKIPMFTRLMGMRRSWIFVTQSIIVLATLQISQLDAANQLNLIALFGLVIAISGATQDIAIDAYRIDRLNDKDNNYMAAGSAMATAGWWTGFAGLGSIPFILVNEPNWQWPEVYQVLSFIMLSLMITVFVVLEPQSNREDAHNTIQAKYIAALPSQGSQPIILIALILSIFIAIIYANIGYPLWPEYLVSEQYQFTSISLFIASLLILMIKLMAKMNKAISAYIDNESLQANLTIDNRRIKITAWLLTTLIAPIQDFFNRNGTKLSIAILLFIFLFKIGEAYLGRMSIVFYREVGFSNADIAYYSKMINWSVTIIFSLIGSIFTIRYGILKGLFIGGIAMAASNLLFAVMAVVGPNKALFAFTVFVDGFTSAWGSVAFVALLSVLCNKTFTASQYALMASLGTFGRVILGSYSGIIVDALDGNWAVFFVITAIMVLPSLAFLYFIRKPLSKLITTNQQANDDSKS